MLSVSILGIKDENKYELIDNSKCDYIHIDIMDGKFVFNSHEYESNYQFNKPIDLHLMVNDVKEYINKYLYLKPNNITFHIEVEDDINSLIELIKSYNIKVGISIKPNTDINSLLPYLNNIDIVLVMSVEPGLGGQKYIENTTNKIEKLKELRKQLNLNFLIEVDGGINLDNYKLNGADIKVVGNYITKEEDFNKPIEELKKL